MSPLEILKASLRVAGDFSPGCKQAARLQSEALDRQLPLRQRFGLRIHLFLCKWCRRYGSQLIFLRSAVQHEGCREQSMSGASLPDDARNRMKSILRQAGK